MRGNKTFVITFPNRDTSRRDGYVRIVNAATVEQVKNFADHEYGNDYACIYTEDDFTEGYYPHGCLKEIDFKHWHDFVT